MKFVDLIYNLPIVFTQITKSKKLYFVCKNILKRENESLFTYKIQFVLCLQKLST